MKYFNVIKGHVYSGSSSQISDDNLALLHLEGQKGEYRENRGQQSLVVIGQGQSQLVRGSHSQSGVVIVSQGQSKLFRGTHSQSEGLVVRVSFWDNQGQSGVIIGSQRQSGLVRGSQKYSRWQLDGQSGVSAEVVLVVDRWIVRGHPKTSAIGSMPSGQHYALCRVVLFQFM